MWGWPAGAFFLPTHAPLFPIEGRQCRHSLLGRKTGECAQHVGNALHRFAPMEMLDHVPAIALGQAEGQHGRQQYAKQQDEENTQRERGRQKSSHQGSMVTGAERM